MVRNEKRKILIDFNRVQIIFETKKPLQIYFTRVLSTRGGSMEIFAYQASYKGFKPSLLERAGTPTTSLFV